jgi:hypothetical protein
MRSRCNTESAGNYRFYGARGIRVCAEWQNFEAFRDWALESGFSPELHIDRIDPDGDYEPGNCQWITPTENFKKRWSDRVPV